MEDTEAENRRELRRRYRNVRDEIRNYSSELVDPSSNKFYEIHNLVDDLFGDVKKAREISIDACALHDLAKGLNTQARNMSEKSSQLDYKHFSIALRGRYTSNHLNDFDWSSLGKHVKCFFASPPSIKYVSVNMCII